ncbi:MAG TPA: carbamoyltransferase HypF [Spirochaetia bacterium]|nr:carbamoyltransferase HypF [Spirochaetia bacterium]
MVNVSPSRYPSGVGRRRLVFLGTVQGVGFRPAVYRVATSLGLSGFVQNRRSEVVAEIQGKESDVAAFLGKLRELLPAAARLEGVRESAVTPHRDGSGFTIRESVADRFAFPPIPPDLPMCDECRGELLNPLDRRYLYPFITCTQCGPRYSIVERTPFDRENTSMRPFEQCPDCLKEFSDPRDRRFHSQTNSCPRCGPRLLCVDAAGSRLDGDPVQRAISALESGSIVALQGIGGFHLAADPSSARAMDRLRRAKERERKPFALMARDLVEAESLCILNQEDRELLRGAESPIVIAPRRAGAPPWLCRVSDTETLGLMLPYTPLHALLFLHPPRAVSYRHLVMTSGNRASEPIITDPLEARRRLADVADVFLVHNRRIAFRTDDSVVRTGRASGTFLLRRSRGYVPRLIRLSSEVRGVVLGLGGDLKSAPTLARGRDVHLCPFNGDLDEPETLAQFDTTIEQTLALYGVVPDLIVRDMHPLYRSSMWALGDRPRQLARGRPVRGVAVQHHFAHALSVMAEHGLEETLALSFDGTGYGTDGTIWGGEFLHATRKGFTRLGSFAPFGLPGGEAAVLNPARIAFSILAPFGTRGVPGVSIGQEKMLLAMLEKQVNCPVTTSLGRIFDAAAAILGLVEKVSYEGEGPIRLEGRALRAHLAGSESLSAGHASGLLPFLSPASDERQFVVDSRPLLAHLLERRSSSDVGELALLFHRCVARASLEGARRMREATGVRRVALCGGVFQNLLLRDLLIPLLKECDFEVLLNKQVPPGDGGLSVGQVWFQEE